MTISSMEELEALAPGASVKVANGRAGVKVLTRVEGGFDIDGTVVEPRWLVGHVAAGEVTNFDTGDPEVGDYFVSGEHGYLAVSVVDGIVTLATFTDSLFRQTITRNLADVRTYRWTRVPPSQRPPWYAVTRALVDSYAQVQQQANALAAQVQSLRTAHNTAVNELAQAKQARAAQVQVVVTGTTTLPSHKAAGKAPSGATVVTVVASWRQEFTITTPPGVGCQCGVVTRELVVSKLGLDDRQVHDFGFTTDCGRH